MNPLSQRIVSVLMRDSNGNPRPNQSRKYLSTMTRQRRNSAMKMLTSGNSDQGTIDFEQFVQRLSVFSLSDDRRDEKLAFAFRVFDAKDDGVIDSEELTYVLKLMTGDKLESRLLRQIVDDTIISVDTDRDGKISISEFKKV
ncbi:hypothetical protein BKA69DRAFT_1053193 [Paraphysoderma sedebokerense]|nr:hypothetical protein BKA69DRAFT_1053131 [Paraphysoderma sedebokerense]KAI9145115.1 hypothetical protein BKA69DRAFT_1053193 [Paraphysoderma sedebokerense]